VSPEFYCVLFLLLLLFKGLTLLLKNSLIEAHYCVIFDLILALLKVYDLVFVNLLNATLCKLIENFFGSNLALATQLIQKLVNFAIALVDNAILLEYSFLFSL